MNRPIGIVLRYADNLMARKVDTIEEHNKIFTEQGKVYVGKIGKFIGEKAISICNDQKIIRCLILVKKNKQGYEYYQAKIESAQATKPPLNLIPEYYRNAKGISTWICINSKLEKLDDEDSKSWIIKSSGMELSHTLRRSMAAYFITRKKSQN